MAPTPIAEEGMALPHRRWRIIMSVRTGKGRTEWAEHEIQVMPAHTPFEKAIELAIETYTHVLHHHPNLVLRTLVEIQECWLTENGGLTEFYTVWTIGPSMLLASMGGEWTSTWPPIPDPV